jgi:hypothetical protein
LANELAAAGGAVERLAGAEPPETLLARANEQVCAALRQGGRLTGRVSIPDDTHPVRTGGRGIAVARYARYALAASILLALGLSAVWVLNRPAPPSRLAEAPETAPAARRTSAPTGRTGAGTGLEEDETPDARQATVVAEAGQPDARPSPARARARRPYRYRSHVEAALCDDTHYVHRAVILPRRSSPRSEPGLEIGRLLSAFEEFDTSRPKRSTGRGPDGE